VLNAIIAEIAVAKIDPTFLRFIPFDGELGEVAEVLLGLVDGFFEPLDFLVGLEGVELGDALDLDFC
jgi:hypothetical protein